MDEKITRNAEMVEPVYLRKLAEGKSYTQLGSLLGLSDSAVSKMLRENACRTATELAAEFLYQKEQGQIESRDIWFVRPGHHADMLETMFKSLGVRFIRFKE